VKQDQAD